MMNRRQMMIAPIAGGMIATTFGRTGLLASVHQTGDQDPAEIIFLGGDIITIDDHRPKAEAVAVTGGRIIALGSADEVLKRKGARTRVMDLAGRTMLPGFIDGHGHCFAVGFQASSANLLPPQDYTVSNIPALVAELKKWATSEIVKRYKVVFGFGYDDAQLEEQRHPTRHELDEVSKELPVVAIHQSGHLCVMNSRALELAGITAESVDPPGGVIVREKDSKTPNGVLEETASMAAEMKLLPKLADAELDALGIRGMELYAANGFTMVQEGRSLASIDKTWMRLADARKMVVDLVSYPDLVATDEPFGIDTPWHSRTLKNGYRIGGVKLSFDGSPQGKTAYLSHPYFIPPHGQEANYKGYSTFPDEEANRKIALCYKKGWQFQIHCNGDAASDQMLSAVKDAQAKFGKDPARRDVMVHCQTVREDQLDTMQELGIFPSFFGMHCYYWGDWHRDSVLGAERAERISPARSALRRGMPFSQHHDAPVAYPSAIRILSSVVTRRTRSNDILGATQCIPVDVALKSLTLWAAYQQFEEQTRGSIEVGKMADFVILDRNPLKVPLLELADLKVVETIKEGQSIYKATSP